MYTSLFEKIHQFQRLTSTQNLALHVVELQIKEENSALIAQQPNEQDIENQFLRDLESEQKASMKNYFEHKNNNIEIKNMH